MSERKPSIRKECVLVVDDAREIREFLCEYVLEPQGFEVRTAADGLQGLQLAFSEQPDLMIVDVQMPHMSGLELLRRVHLRRLDIPAILITAHGSEQVAVKALRLGVRDYVIKPFVVKEMEEAIERALRENRLREERNQLVQQLERSNASLRKRAQELNALYGIGKAISSSQPVEQVLERVVEAAIYLSGADEGALQLIDEERGELYVHTARNIGRSDLVDPGQFCRECHSKRSTAAKHPAGAQPESGDYQREQKPGNRRPLTRRRRIFPGQCQYPSMGTICDALPRSKRVSWLIRARVVAQQALEPGNGGNLLNKSADRNRLYRQPEN